MEKKVLIAVDESRHSENALRYAAAMNETVSNIKWMLLHVQSTISLYLLDEAKKSPRAYAELEKLMRKNADKGLELVERYRGLLVSLGVGAADVQITTLPYKLGVAKDILEYGMAMGYDAIMVGRRGLSGVAEAFIGSTSANIVNNTQLTPIWLVEERGPAKTIMVSVDGSETSLRAVDHLAFILSGSQDVALTFFHIAPHLADICPVDFSQTETATLEAIIQQGDKACIDQFYAHALKKLKAVGIEERQIQVVSRQGGFRVGKAVLDAYRQGRFGTLVVGRRGMGRQVFTGSVSRYLINQFSDGALWVVP